MIETLTKLYAHPAVRFLAVGGANFVVTYAVYLLTLLAFDYRIAFGVAFIAGLLFTSVLTIRHTFTQRLSVVRVTLYGGYYLLYFFVNIRLIELLVEGYGIDEKWAPFVSLVVLTPVHYLLSKLLVAAFSRYDGRGRPESH